ncbi:MAG TPA: hypothetical protein VFZ37_10065 [Jiangellaceae bacterium]
MIESLDTMTVVAIVGVSLAVIGLTIAWLPGLRYSGIVTLAARLLIGAGLLSVVLDSRGLGVILGLGLTALGALAAWEGRPAPEVPRPRRKGVIIAALITALVMLAAMRGWWLFGRVPDDVRPVVALALGGVAALGTLAIADRSRIKMRDAVRERFA